MRNVLLKLLAAVLLFPATVWAAEPGVGLSPANNDIGNVASLQRGARYFMNYCQGCHSLQYIRYNRIAQDLKLTERQLLDNLVFTGAAAFDLVRSSMPPADAERWFGVVPPDLTLIARLRGTDYLYTFLRSFYQDPKVDGASNNLVLPNTSMPPVLWELQGVRRAVYGQQTDADGHAHEVRTGFETVIAGTLGAGEFDQVVRDIVNFLEYVSEPMQLTRQRMGFWVILFLLGFLYLAWQLKREVWIDVK